MLEVIIIALLVFIIVREVINYNERHDMLDRLMAKDFTEYKDNVELEENLKEEKPNTEIEIEDAEEEIMNG